MLQQFLSHFKMASFSAHVQSSAAGLETRKTGEKKTRSASISYASTLRLEITNIILNLQRTSNYLIKHVYSGMVLE